MFQADDSDDDEGEEISEVDLLQVRLELVMQSKFCSKQVSEVYENFTTW